VNDSSDSVLSLYNRLTSPAGLSQLVIILLAALAGLAFAQSLRSYRKRRAAQQPEPARWQVRVFHATEVVSPIILVIVLLLLARGLLSRFSTDTRMLDTALRLTSTLLMVRLGFYLLRQALGPDSWLRSWETRLSIIVWLLIGFEQVGWFETTQRWLDTIDLVPGKGAFSLWDLMKGLVVVASFFVITSLIARAIEQRVMKLEGLAVSTRIGISKFTYFLLVGIGILLGINSVGIDLTALGVLTGAIGLGLGFGLQTIAGNFVSGFVLLLDKSIKPGDVISFTQHTGTTTENFGWVQELKGRYVVVRDRDGVETLVPNQNLITTPVINWSYSDQRVRIRLPVMLSYEDDPELGLKVLLEATQNHPRILREPPPVTRLMSFEDYGMRLEVRFWIADPMNGVNNVRSDMNRIIWRLFRANNLTIPVAQREIRVSDASRARGLPKPLAPDPQNAAAAAVRTAVQTGSAAMPSQGEAGLGPPTA